MGAFLSFIFSILKPKIQYFIIGFASSFFVLFGSIIFYFLYEPIFGNPMGTALEAVIGILMIVSAGAIIFGIYIIKKAIAMGILYSKNLVKSVVHGIIGIARNR